MQLSGLFYHPIYGGYIHTVNRLLASQMRISWSVLLANKIGEEFTEQPSALASNCTALKSVKLKRKSLKGQQCLSIKQQFQSYMPIIDKQIFKNNRGVHVILVSLFGRPIVQSISHFFFGQPKENCPCSETRQFFLSTLLIVLSSLDVRKRLDKKFK